MNTEKAQALLIKYKNGELSPEEEVLLNQWYLSAIAESKEALSEDELNESYFFLKANLPLAQNGKTTRLWPRMVGLAAAVALVILGVWFFNYSKDAPEQESSKVDWTNNDIAAGKQGATLTLANGKKIKLSDVKNGQLANEAGVVITKTEDGSLVYELNGKGTEGENTMSTANGETYAIKLPDGSKVWLNAASSITYSSTLLKNGRRSIQLSGEAYFEVAKDQKHPFVVESRGQEVSVLGTHFNINSYLEEPGIATTLLEGSVSVSVGKMSKIIRPGEQVSNQYGKLEVGPADLEHVMDWKNGDFYLNRVNFKTAMRKIARWYDVEVIYDSSVPDELEFGGWVSRKNNLSAVLGAIETSGFAHFKVEGRKVYVSK